MHKRKNKYGIYSRPLKKNMNLNWRKFFSIHTVGSLLEGFSQFQIQPGIEISNCGWLNPWKWNLWLQRADYGFWVSSEFGKCRGLLKSTPPLRYWGTIVHRIKYSVFERKEILPFMPHNVNEHSIMLGEISQLQKNKYCISSLMWGR